MAVAQPRRIVDLGVREAQLLEHARSLRRARAALAVDDGFLGGVEPSVQSFRCVGRLERHAGVTGDLLARELGGGFGIDPVLLVRDIDCARNMTAANCADVFADELPRSADIDDLHIRIVQPRHHLFGRDRRRGIDLQIERDRRKLRGVTADRPAGGGPVLDAVMIETDIAAAEILQSVKTEIGIPCAAAAVDDDFASRIETRRAEYLLDAIRRDEILGIVVAQNSRRIADADGARNVSLGIGIGGSYVPNNGISRDGLGDIVAIDNDRGRGHRGWYPQEQQWNEEQTFHDEPSVSLLSSGLLHPVHYSGSDETHTTSNEQGCISPWCALGAFDARATWPRRRNA